MAELAALMEIFAQDERMQQITSSLTGGGPGKLHLPGLAGSAEAFVTASVFKQTNFNHLIILEDKEAAAYFQNDLATLLGKKDIHFFPDSFNRPGRFDQLNTSNILLRTESINKFLKGKNAR